METKEFRMTEDFYAEEDQGMFSSALESHLAQMDEYAENLATCSAKLESAVASGDLVLCAGLAPLIFESCSCLYHSVADTTAVFSQDDIWALSYAEEKLRQYSLKVSVATEDECEGEAIQR